MGCPFSARGNCPTAGSGGALTLARWVHIRASSHLQVAGTQPQSQQPRDDHIEDDDEQEDDHDAGLVDQQVPRRVHQEHDGAQEEGAALDHLAGERGAQRVSRHSLQTIIDQ